MGCGDGSLLRELSGRLKPDLAVGLDIELGGTENGIVRICGDAGRSPIRTGTAGVVACNALLHHVDHPASVITEISRMISSGGWLFIAEGSRLVDSDFAQMNRELREAGLPVERHAGFEADRLTRWVEDSGMSVVRLEMDGESTFATPPFVSRAFTVPRLLIAART